jgi:sulfonate transport system permease protein
MAATSLEAAETTAMNDSNRIQYTRSPLLSSVATFVRGTRTPSPRAGRGAAARKSVGAGHPILQDAGVSWAVPRGRGSLPEFNTLASRLFAACTTTAKAAGGFFWSYGAILLFLLTWQLLSQFEVVDSSVIPPFTKVVAAMVHGFSDGGLLGNVLVSLRRSGIGFGIATLLAVPLGLFMGSFKRFEGFIDALLQMFRQTSALAIYPIFILLLGLGETSKIMIIGWAAFFPVLLNTISGVQRVDARLIEMARVFGASRREVFKRVVLPAATPAIFVGLRLSATTSLLLLVAAEMIGAKKGLGFLIINSQYNFEIPLMFASIVLLAIIGLTVNYTLVVLQQWFCRWERPRQVKSR